MLSNKFEASILACAASAAGGSPVAVLKLGVCASAGLCGWGAVECAQDWPDWFELSMQSTGLAEAGSLFTVSDGLSKPVGAAFSVVDG